MEVLVRLSSTHRHLLLRSVPEYSKVWNALDTAVPPCRLTIAWGDPEYIVICDEAGAEALLEVARKDCPDAAKNVERAIESSQNPHAKQERFQ
jgi:hypothetical protein